MAFPELETVAAGNRLFGARGEVVGVSYVSPLKETIFLKMQPSLELHGRENHACVGAPVGRVFKKNGRKPGSGEECRADEAQWGCGLPTLGLGCGNRVFREPPNTSLSSSPAPAKLVVPSLTCGLHTGSKDAKLPGLFAHVIPPSCLSTAGWGCLQEGG